jgi:hypothetical protein
VVLSSLERAPSVICHYPGLYFHLSVLLHLHHPPDFERMVDRYMVPKFSIPTTENVFVGLSTILSAGARNSMVSIAVISRGISMVFQGFNYGIDFTGAFLVVRFDRV